MAAAMARFFADNWEGHLDRWSPPAAPGFFGMEFWRDRLERAPAEWEAGSAARFVLQPRGAAEGGPIIGTCNYTNIVRGAFHACHLGYQVAAASQGHGLMAEALTATNGFMFEAMRMHRLMANFRPENVRSRALLRRLGFVEEGLARLARPRAHVARAPALRRRLGDPAPLRPQSSPAPACASISEMSGWRWLRGWKSISAQMRWKRANICSRLEAPRFTTP
jgi:ribosomal-protein-alanine N-acetyltransferase